MGKLKSIDIQQNNKVIKSSVAECCIARKGDDTFITGSMAIGIQVEDEEVWSAINARDVYGNSMEASVSKAPEEIEIDIPKVIR